jgi:hypothetical protein
MFVTAATRVRNASALRLAKATVSPMRPVSPCEEKRLVTASTCSVAGSGRSSAADLVNEIMG